MEEEEPNHPQSMMMMLRNRKITRSEWKNKLKENILLINEFNLMDLSRNKRKVLLYFKDENSDN